jgi:homoserine dehydrogenase
MERAAILQSLASGKNWAEAVTAAEDAGFAEANSARDLSGRDSADKLTILCAHAFESWIAPGLVPTAGIDTLDGDYGQYQLVARARRTESGIKASVAPEILPIDSFLGQSRGVENRLEIELSTGGVIRLRGLGAGRWPTTVSVLGDLHEVARVIHARPSSPSPDASLV